MPNVYMDDIKRVQTIGPTGRGMYPSDPASSIDKMTSAGREMEEVTHPEHELPNPSAASDGAVLQVEDSSWNDGGDGGLPKASTATDGMVIVADDGEWIAANPTAVITDIGDFVADAYSSSLTYDVGDYVVYDDKLYKCTTAITTAEAWDSDHWTATTVTEGLTLVATDSDSDGNVVLGYQ